jgi:HK97 family phage major capsid protein
MHLYLKKLVDERNALTGLMQQVDDKAVSDDRQLSDAESERMRGWQQRCGDLDREITEQNEYLTSQRAWAKLQDQLSTNDVDEPARRGSTAIATRAPATSWGELFTSSPAFQNYDGTGSSGRVEVPGLFTRAPIDSSFVDAPPHTFAPALWTMTTPLLDVIGRETVSSGNVEWIKWPAAYPEAGEVAEGALKPEADLAPEEQAAALKTYAHFKGITRQALEDFARIQQIIETALRGGVLRKLESATAGVLTDPANGIPVETNADLLTGIRVAIGNVQAAGYAQPNAILLNPADFAALDISVMGSTVAGPNVNTGFWGVRALAVGAVPAGTAYVGDFHTGVTLFERGAASVYMTDSHADYFVRNILVILAETRALPVVTEPAALYRVTVGAPAGGGA